MDLSIITGSFNGLTDIQKKAFEKSIKEADVNRDNVLDKKEFTEAIQKFSETDEFKSLSAENQNSFKEKLKPDAIWGQQGAASVINYDGNKLQIEYYERALRDGKKDKDGNPIVTKEQLEYARNNGFGDMNGDKKITGLELAVADLDGNKRIGAKDGDLNGDGKVNKEDRGVSLGSSSKSNKGLDPKVVAFIEELIKIWAPQSAGNTSAAQTQAGIEISKALGGIERIMAAAKTRTTTTPTS
jgi:hypothetical protein